MCLHACRSWLFTATIVFGLAVLAACGSSGDGEETDGDGAVTDGDNGGPCEEGKQTCAGTLSIICRDSRWETIVDCADSGDACDKGLCVPLVSDGDDEEAGEDGDAEDDSPIQDTTPPEVQSTSPQDGASGIDPLIGAILINFSEPLDPENFVPRRDVSFTAGGTEVFFRGSLESQNQQVRLGVDPLDEGRTYTVSIAGGVLRDPAGNVFAGITFSFTTSGIADGDGSENPDGDQGEDTTAPSVNQTYPEDNETNVDPYLPYILIVFSEPMNLEGFPFVSKISVVGSDSHQPPWRPQPENGYKHLKLILQAELHEATRYTVSFAEGLADLAGNPLGALDFGFTTASLPDGDAETDGDGVGDPLVDDVTISEICLADPGSWTPETHPEALEASWNDGRLIVVHRNAIYGSCLDSVIVEMEASIGLVSLHELAHFPWICEELCPRDVTIEIVYLNPGGYTIEVYPDGADTPLETTVGAP